MGNGYQVATEGLRRFARILSDQAEQYGDLELRVEGGKVYFESPVVGLPFKSDFNDAAQTVQDALHVFSQELATAGTALTAVADNYAEQERHVLEEEARQRQQASGVDVP